MAHLLTTATHSLSSLLDLNNGTSISTSSSTPPTTTSTLFEAVSNQYAQTSIARMAFLVAAVMTLVRWFLAPSGVKAPFSGYRSAWEPGFLVRLRFMFGAKAMILDGYKRFKDSMYKVSRNDGDILILSNKYVDELRGLPEENLSAILAHQHNLLGFYSTTQIMAESDLHTRVLQTKLTPNLAQLLPLVKEELDLVLAEEFSKLGKGELADHDALRENKALTKDTLDEWSEVCLNDIILRVVARISARVFVGEELCRDKEWLRLSVKYTEDVFMVILTLRFFYPWMRPFIAAVLPAVWKVRADVRKAKKIMVPVINESRRLAREKPGMEKTMTLLQWMVDAANEQEGRPEKLAHRQLLLSLASIHTTTMATLHAVYDMCSMPEYYEPLREEIVEVLNEDQGWQKSSLNKMRKMDSFMRESQRFSASSLLTFNRLVQTPIQLSDGTHLPTGTLFCMAAGAIARDPKVVPDPTKFDGLRWYTKRQDPKEANKHQHAMTDSNTMHFGHGRYACPGRFFASNEIKLILAHLVMNYDFKFPDGKGRPETLTLDENMFPDPKAKILIKRRPVEQALKPLLEIRGP